MPNVIQNHRRPSGLAAASGPTAGHAAGFASASSQRLHVASNANLLIPAATDVSVAVWAFPTAAGSYRTVIGKQGGTTGTDEYGIQIAFPAATSLWEFWIRTATDYQAIDSVGAVTLNQWTHIAGTYSHTAGVMNLYLNGAGAFTTRLGGSIQQTATELSLGGLTATSFFDGRVDMAGIWTRVLSSGEVTTLYNGGAGLRMSQLPAGLMTGLVGAWDLDGPAGDGLWHDTVNASHLANTGGVTVVAGLT